MAVLIASRLRKEFSGDPLFDGVSFKVERRDRLALAGPNGAGKTTLLRMLTGETRLDGGELAFEKGTRVALHDQRPSLERALTLREYVLDGAKDLVAAEEDMRRLESAMAATAPTRSPPTRLPRPGSSTRAATAGATMPHRSCAGSGSRTTSSTAACGRSRVAS
jgi:ATPase subunit of ABC transporter with duplicated ATPase domains